MMIYLRPRLIKWGILGSSLGFSTTRTPIENASNTQNPFKNKSYSQIKKIMSLGISQKNELTFCNYILKTSIERLAQQTQHMKMPSDRAVKEELINNVLDKVMSNHLTKLTAGDMYRIIQLESLIVDNRFLKLNQSNRNKFRNELLSQLKLLIDKDKNGDQVRIFKLILYELVKSKKRLKVTKDIIEHLKKHSLRSNQQLIQFFKIFSNLDHGGYYDNDIVQLLSRYVLSEKNTMSNTHEWVQTIIMEVLVDHSDSLRISPNSLISKFIEGLQIELKQGKVTTSQKLIYFKYLLSWVKFGNPYYLVCKQISRVVNLTYSIFKQVTSILKQNKNIDPKTLQNIFQCSNNFKDFASVGHKILGKSENELLEELNDFARKAYKEGFFKQFESLNFNQIVSMINVGIELPREQEISLIRKIIKMLNDKKQQSSLINRIRLIEYAAKSIYEGKSVDKSQIQPLLRDIQKKSKQLKEYEIIRICNIFRLLGLKSKELDDYFSYKISKNEIFAIENMSRTMLKQYSYDLILKSLDSLRVKYNNNVKGSDQISEALWFAFKVSNVSKAEQNLDPIFFYWFVEHLQTFKSITQKYENSRRIIANSIKQINIKVKGIQSQITLQLLIEVLHSWATQNKKSKGDEFNKFYILNLKQLLESRHLIQVGMINSSRHSLPIKILQSFHTLINFNQSSEHHKRMIEIIQILHLMKKEGPIHFSERPSVRFLLLARNVHHIDINQEWKLKNYKNVIDRQFFFNYHSDQLSFSHQAPEKKSWFRDSLSAAMNESLGPLFFAQWRFTNKKMGLLTSQQQITSMFKDTMLPVNLYTGTLTKQQSLNPNQILDSFIFPKTIEFLMHRFPNIADAYIEQIMRIKNPLLSHKLIQASNMLHLIKELVSLPVRDRFREWLKQTLIREYPVDQNPSILEIYLKLNLTPNSPQVLARYISQQLASLNFSIVSYLYTNGYFLTQKKEISCDISAKFAKFVKPCCGNHWLEYLVEFDYELVLTTTSFFGLALQIQQNQTKIQAIIECIHQFIEREGQEQALVKNIDTLVKSFRNNQRSCGFQMYMILRLVSVTLDESLRQTKIVMEMLNKILTANPSLQTDLFSFYIQESRSQLSKFYPSDLKYASSSSQFPEYKGKLVWLHNGQPGIAWIIDQYLSKCAKNTVVSTLNVYQIQGSPAKLQNSQQSLKKEIEKPETAAKSPGTEINLQ